MSRFKTIAVAVLLAGIAGASPIAALADEPAGDELAARADSMERKTLDLPFYPPPDASEGRFVEMSDGVRLAVSLYYPKDFNPASTKAPAVFEDSVYGRTEDAMTTAIDLYRAAGFVVVIGDARGFAASFGFQPGFNTAQQTHDEGEVIQWIAAQPWSNGKVAAIGHSVSATFADSMTASGAPALKAAIIRASDFDEYSLNMFPGGIPNLSILGLADELMNWHAGRDCLAALAACAEVGFRPVDNDTDFRLLQAAAKDHQGNLTGKDFAGVTYRDDMLGSAPIVESGPVARVDAIRAAAVPARVPASWLDGLTATGALARYAAAEDVPMEVVIGATTHPGGVDADPFSVEPFAPARPSAVEQFQGDVAFVQRVFAGDKIGRSIRYVVLGTDTWKTTAVWPPAGVQNRSLELAPGKLVAESSASGEVPYDVDPATTSGPFNRWAAQRGKPVFYGDRRSAPGKRLVFTGAPLDEDAELVGSPELCLVMKIDQPDGSIFAHVEDVAPDGRITYLTEGLLRLLHRKTSGEPCDPQSVGARTFNKADGAPVQPGEVMKVGIELLPVAAVIRQGHSVRLSLAGADEGTVAAADKVAHWTVSYGGPASSRLTLPMRPWSAE